MTDEPAGGSYGELPGEHVTIDQLVAMNVRRWRRAAKFTQEELGERIGWSAPNVSAAELSADPGKDKRRFDAQTLVAIAMALDIPLIALFLPPDDDGVRVRYLYHAHDRGASCDDMPVLFGLLMPDGTGEGPAEKAWREAFGAAVNHYLDAGRGAELISYLEDMTTAEQRAARLERIRWLRQALAAAVDDYDQMAVAIEEAGGAS